MSVAVVVGVEVVMVWWWCGTSQECARPAARSCWHHYPSPPPPFFSSLTNLTTFSHPTSCQAFRNMLRVLALTIVGCLGLTLAFSPVYPVSTLHVANKKCRAAQTDVLSLLLLLGRRGGRPGPLHVCYAVSTTSGGSSYDEGFPGVRTLASGVAGVLGRGGPMFSS